MRCGHRVMIGLCCIALSISGCTEEKKAEIKAKIAHKKREVRDKVDDLKDTIRNVRGVPTMLKLSDEERAQKLRDDLEAIRRYDAGLQRTLAYARSRPELFPRHDPKAMLADPKLALDAAQAPDALTADQHEALIIIWATVLDYMRALDGIKRFWRRVHKINVVTSPQAHADAFLVGYAAWMVQYRHGVDFIGMTVPSRTLETILDEAQPRASIGAKSFRRLKWHIVHVKAIARLLGSRQYYGRLLGDVLGAEGCVGQELEPCTWAASTITAYHSHVLEQLRDKAAISFSYNAFDIVRDFGFEAWFPIQAGVAEWMGDTKVARLHSHLITKAQVDAMRPALEPGDLIVARHNWYLSNVGLPGFWPHAALYLSSHQELARYFDDDEVKAYFKRVHKAASLPAYLKTRAPDAWAAYTKPARDGFPRRVLEALSEGVVLSSLEFSAGVDYTGVLRPRASKLDKAKAIVRAFGFLGRPYDFNFDFLTEESLVCTEVVYKAWAPEQDLGLELVEVMGRRTLPANTLVEHFDAQAGQDARKLDFVYFLDGRERLHGAIVADEAAFRASWKRPKWDVLQK